MTTVPIIYIMIAMAIAFCILRDPVHADGGGDGDCGGDCGGDGGGD